MTVDSLNFVTSDAVRAALEVATVLRHAAARGEHRMGLDAVLAATGLDRDTVLWGLRVLEHEDLVDVHQNPCGLTLELRAPGTLR